MTQTGKNWFSSSVIWSSKRNEKLPDDIAFG